MTKAACGAGAPRMGSLRAARRRRVRSSRPPSPGRIAAVAPEIWRSAPVRTKGFVCWRFSTGLTRTVLATRHPFAETALRPVRCSRLCEPPRPKQTTGASGSISLAQSLDGRIRRQENRIELLQAMALRRPFQICRRPVDRPPTSGLRPWSRGCDCSRVRAPPGARRLNGDVWTAPVWPLR